MVIAVIGMLAAIAVPAYNAYQIKSKVTKSLIVVDAVGKDALSYYSRKGVFPNSITVNNVTFANSIWTSVNYGAIKAMGYEVNSNAFMINVSLTGLEGIPSYIAPIVPVPTTGGRSALTYAIRDIGNGVTKTVCGQYSPGVVNDAIPTTYLPANCTCTDVNAFYTNGTGC